MKKLPIKLALPDGFLEEETREGYVVSAKMKELWAVQLDMVAEFQRVCDAAGLKWWACGGTILGAVRHKGYIPWDDDIDLMMMRDDYERLCEIAPKVFAHPYFWQTEATDPWSGRHHAQLRNSLTTCVLTFEVEKKYPFNQGIFIDVFPIDHIPDDEAQADAYLKRLEVTNAAQRRVRNLTFYTRRKSVIKSLHNYILHLVKYRVPAKVYPEYKQLDDEMEAAMTEFNATPCKRLLQWPALRKPMLASDFDDTIMMPFEMLQLPIPAGFENQMVVKYGKEWRTPRQTPTAHGGLIIDAYTPYNKKDL